MTLAKLASLIAKREGKKSQARIGDVREILRLLVDLEDELFGTSESPVSAISKAVSARQVKRASTMIKRMTRPRAKAGR